ncbi:MAG: HAMP domain-containing protein [Planctomycetaceae bacterium]|nr:HAMP domain-containing protein [Planctomycetaceae bacterium]
MPFGSLNELSGSLRFRLTLWNTLIMLLLIVVTLLGVRTAVWYALLHEIEQLLNEDLTEMRLTVESNWPNLALIEAELERKSITHTHRGLYARLINGDGDLVFKSSTAPDKLVVPYSDASEFGPRTLEGFRLAQQRTRRRDMPLHVVRAGVSLRELHHELQAITNLLVMVGLAALVITPLGGYLLAMRATQPIREIIETTHQLRPDDLDSRRLPIRGTRDELDQLSSTVNGFLDRIAAFINQGRRFTADAAHELRSPLTAIQSSLEVTLNSDRTIDEYKEAITGVLEECDRLRALVNQLLTLAEVDREKIRPDAEIIDLAPTVRRSCDMFQAVAETQGINLELSIASASIRGDAGRMRQVINNLLDNAIKFTPGGGKVRVELFERYETREVVLSVSDTGAGIDDLDLPFIFERFYCGDKSRHRLKKATGTGLGLSIVGSTVAAHGGHIGVTSERGHGTKFTVTLPLAVEASEPITEPADASITGVP